MASDVVAIPEERGIETHGIERVSPETRTHVRIFDNFTMWLAANLVISTIALGTLATFFGLGFWGSVATIVIFNALGVLPVAFFSTLGPKLGLRQMTLTRFAFGWVGGIIMAIFNVGACIAWSAVNVIVGGQLAVSLSNGAIPLWAGVIVIAILTTIVSIYGYRYVHYYERWAWIPMAIMFLIMFIVGIPHFAITAATTSGLPAIAGFFTFGGAIYGFATGWSSYAADYNVNQPENTRSSRVFWLTFLGVFIPCVLLETLGMAFTLANYKVWNDAFNSGSVGGLLSEVVSPLGGFGKFLLVLLALSIIANNIPNDYSLGLSVQVFGKAFQKVKRYIWTLIGAVIYIAIAIIGSANFSATLSSFLLDVGYWLGAYAIILVLEHFVFRHGHYDVDDWNTPGKLPLGWAAIVALIAGLIGALLGADQLNFQGFITRNINQPYGIDLGFEMAIVLAGVVYLILRPIEKRQTGR
ncbi:MAG TPA: cytosine permease [Ktedonobacteraceae bacterium]|nr:cytosine permease [Ktedonobacteraceae bacterium]